MSNQPIIIWAEIKKNLPNQIHQKSQDNKNTKKKKQKNLPSSKHQQKQKLSVS